MKTGNPNPTPTPEIQTPMPPMDSADAMPQMDNTQQPNAMGGNPNLNGDMPQEGNGDSPYDTGFDAGVEADEDEDPKKFIQQLTGKLSQSLNKYNNENGDDAELSKYVGKMIARAAAKGLDEKGKKDLIKTINTTESDEDEGMPDNSEGMDDEQMSDEMPMNECVFKKSEIKVLKEELNQHLGNDKSNMVEKDIPKRSKKKTPFSAKQFK